jgi:hypothetical protein
VDITEMKRAEAVLRKAGLADSISTPKLGKEGPPS